MPKTYVWKLFFGRNLDQIVASAVNKIVFRKKKDSNCLGTIWENKERKFFPRLFFMFFFVFREFSSKLLTAILSILGGMTPNI
jgi:hypothetical protein